MLSPLKLSSEKNHGGGEDRQLDKLTEVGVMKAELEEKEFKAKVAVIDTMSTTATCGQGWSSFRYESLAGLDYLEHRDTEGFGMGSMHGM